MDKTIPKRMSLGETIIQQLKVPTIILGYSSAATLSIFEHFEMYVALFLSVVTALSTAIYHLYKIIAIRNEERRKQERHRQEMQQDEQLHQKNLKDGEAQ